MQQFTVQQSKQTLKTTWCRIACGSHACMDAFTVDPNHSNSTTEHHNILRALMARLLLGLETKCLI